MSAPDNSKRSCSGCWATAGVIIGVISGLIVIWEFGYGPSHNTRILAEQAIKELSKYEADLKTAKDFLNQGKRPTNRVYLLANSLLKLLSDGSYEITGDDELSRSARRLRRDARPYFLMGVVFLEKSRPCAAIEAFEKSHKRDRSFAPSKSLLGAAILAQMYALDSDSTCSEALLLRSVEIEDPLDLSRAAASTQSGASLYYHLSDSLLLAANIEVDRGRRAKYVTEAEDSLKTARELDTNEKREARMMARWYIVLSTVADYDDEVRKYLEEIENEAWGLFDLAVYERCKRDNVSEFFEIWDRWRALESDGPSADKFAESGMAHLKEYVSNKNKACDRIMEVTSPLLWSASQAIVAMGEQSRP